MTISFFTIVLLVFLMTSESDQIQVGRKKRDQTDIDLKNGVEAIDNYIKGAVENVKELEKKDDEASTTAIIWKEATLTKLISELDRLKKLAQEALIEIAVIAFRKEHTKEKKLLENLDEANDAYLKSSHHESKLEILKDHCRQSAPALRYLEWAHHRIVDQPTTSNFTKTEILKLKTDVQTHGERSLALSRVCVSLDPSKKNVTSILTDEANTLTRAIEKHLDADLARLNGTPQPQEGKQPEKPQEEQPHEKPAEKPEEKPQLEKHEEKPQQDAPAGIK
jgi:hypothetical protein